MTQLIYLPHCIIVRIWHSTWYISNAQFYIQGYVKEGIEKFILVQNIFETHAHRRSSKVHEK